MSTICLKCGKKYTGRRGGVGICEGCLIKENYEKQTQSKSQSEQVSAQNIPKENSAQNV